MVLGIAEDFSTDVNFDVELLAASSTGLVLNSGTHPTITIENLLSFLPFYSDFDLFDPAVTYTEYNKTKRRQDIVLYNGVIYQSLIADNKGNTPDSNGSKWLETNIESLTLKSFIGRVQDRVYTELNLNRRLINSQYLYEVGRQDVVLPGKFAAWVFEAKGSDYISFTINQISLQANTTQNVNMYVINEGKLIDTIVLKPNNGELSFKELGYTFNGKGKWVLAIDSQSVKISGNTLDPLAYDGFVCYTAINEGLMLDPLAWVPSLNGNGIGLDISVSLNSSLYIDDNTQFLGNFVRATFELMALQMMLHNSGNRLNRQERNQREMELIAYETKKLDDNTVARRFETEKARATKALNKTFDTQLATELNDDFNIEIGTV